MKKLRKIIFIIGSITSLVAECQNNLNQTTKTILENIQILKKNLNSLAIENKIQNTNLSVEQIIKMLLMQETLQNYDFQKSLENKKQSHNQLEIAVRWFEKTKEICDWIEYFAIHSQMLTAIEQELNQLKLITQMHNFCKEIGQRILTVFIDAIILLHNNPTTSKNILASLIYTYQDYAKLFKNYIQINNPEIIIILKKENFL